ncbi:uncharacterized protein V6R79_017617 [Siganus canaliculatus]
MVLDMQARMTDMSSNLRLDFQEDASKMLTTLLNNVREPVSARGAETQTLQVDDFSFEHDTPPMDKVMKQISQVSNDLESKSNTLDDLLSRVNRHDTQIHLLMEASHGQQPTTPPAPTTSDTGLRGYLDEQIRILRDELMEGMEIKMADLKSSCDYKILSVQDQCEGQEANYLSLAELMDSKEMDLRNEIQDLKTMVDHPGKGDSLLVRVENLEIQLNSSDRCRCFTVEEKLKAGREEALKELQETLEEKLVSMEDRLTTMLVDPSNGARSSGQTEKEDVLQRDVNSLRSSVQTLEGRFDALDQLCSNVTVIEKVQQDVQSCRRDADALETRLEAQIQDLKELAGHFLNSSTSTDQGSYLSGQVGRLEDSLTEVIRQQSHILHSLNSTWGQQEAGDLSELHRAQHRELRTRLDELGREVTAKADHCREQADNVQKEVAGMDSRIVNVESLCSKLDPISGSLQRIKEGLNKHVTGLWTCVNQLNSTVRAHTREIVGVKGTCQNLQNIISNAAGDAQMFTNNRPDTKGVQVTVEDPGHPQGSNKSPPPLPVAPPDTSIPQPPVLETGVAGPPSKMSSSKLPRGTDGSTMPVQGFAGAPASPHVRLTDSLSPDSDLNLAHRPSLPRPVPVSGETVSFSAGLTLPLQGEAGIIRFNKVLVNDGGHYDDLTGVFTAPTDGRYLVTAVLTAPRGETFQAVLSVSNRSIQKLDSTGLEPDAAAVTSSRDRCDCGGSTALSLVLSMERGDRAGLVLTSGKLAVSSSSEILSSFSAVLLYPSPSKR